MFFTIEITKSSRPKLLVIKNIPMNTLPRDKIDKTKKIFVNDMGKIVFTITTHNKYVTKAVKDQNINKLFNDFKL